MASADSNFYPAVFIASVSRERGFSEQRISEALEKLKSTLVVLEGHLEGREYRMDGFSLADIAYAGNFVRQRELAKEDAISLANYPNVSVWMERVEYRESYKAATRLTALPLQRLAARYS